MYFLHLLCCLQLEEELEALAQAVLELAGSSAGGGAAGPWAAPAGQEEGDDIVLEFGSLPKPANAGQVGLADDGDCSQMSLTTHAAMGLRYMHPRLPALQAASVARRALADISAAQAAAARGLEDQRRQIRLLQESGKLQRLRRASALDKQQAQRQ